MSRSVRALVKRIPVVGELARRAFRLRQRRELARWFSSNDGLQARAAARLSRVAPYTVLDPARLSNLRRCAVALRARAVAGSIVECGSYGGGSGALLGEVVRSDPGRHVYLFDSWQGVPEPTEADWAFDGMAGFAGMCAAPRERAEEVVFGVFGLDRERVHLVEGWFEDTLPKMAEEVSPIALLHVDADWYESVRICLEALYDRVSPGGAVIIDDYGAWEGARKALDEFIDERGLEVELERVDWTAVMFEKPLRAHQRLVG